MSHLAVNWALEQTGLKPAAKLVLICLADRHNKDTGECFPSQDKLAEDACMSRSSVNDQLDRLEALGLIEREPVIDPKTKRQKATRYHLKMAIAVSEITTRAVSEKQGEPCPKKAKSRVRNSDTNPVKITGKEPGARDARAAAADFSDEFCEELFSALGLDRSNLPPRWKGAAAVADVQAWLDLGLTEPQIVTAARESRVKHPEPPEGPKALDAVMHAAARAAKTAETPVATRGEVLSFWAEKLNAGRFVAPSSISISVADDLIREGLVAAEIMRSRGIAHTREGRA